MPNPFATTDDVGQELSCGEAQNEPMPSMGYVKQLRREAQNWRLKYVGAERENARLRIALILLENGVAPAKTMEGAQ